ncbi:Palmitoyl-protein_thioesterase [Hexamita inflata]|uniref:Palmitoyl-protein thioesterase 1 n=1 Tax=Hexamita inflata TaxID=28002 RepID=A0AA86RVS0_9EUKA|nr:Palmitoyl-protein thioesterase [Hexamita inflata]
MLLLGLCQLKQVPIVLMHGILEDGNAMMNASKWLKQEIPGLYVKICDVGIGKERSIFTSVEDQLAEFVICVNNDPQLKDGFIGLGFSQGGLVVRGYLERYNHIMFPMLRFIGLASPLAGEFCGVQSDCLFILQFPDWLNELINNIEFSDFMFEHFSITSYWRDPYHLQSYLQNGRYLLDLDNERQFNPQYKKNFMSVDKLVLFGSEHDGIIQPWQSSWFGFWKEGTDSIIEPMEKRSVYENDLFGLKTMNEEGRIVLKKTSNTHVKNIHNELFITKELAPFVKMEY